MMEYSKDIYNSAVYCQRRYHDVWKLICQYYLENFDVYKETFTHRDVEVLYKICIKNAIWNIAKELYAMYGGSK